MVADVIGSCLCDCEKVGCAGLQALCSLTAQVDMAVSLQVQMDLSAEDLAHITSHAGLDMNASPLDLIELPWLRPARLNLLVQLQV